MGHQGAQTAGASAAELEAAGWSATPISAAGFWRNIAGTVSARQGGPRATTRTRSARCLGRPQDFFNRSLGALASQTRKRRGASHRRVFTPGNSYQNHRTARRLHKHIVAAVPDGGPA